MKTGVLKKKMTAYTDTGWTAVLALLWMICIIQLCLIIDWSKKVIMQNRMVSRNDVLTRTKGHFSRTFTKEPSVVATCNEGSKAKSQKDLIMIDTSINVEPTTLKSDISKRQVLKINVRLCGCQKNDNNNNNNDELRVSNMQYDPISLWTVVVVQACFAFGLLYMVITAAMYTYGYLRGEVNCTFNFRFGFFLAQRACLHGYFIGRLHKVFDGSMYAVTPMFLQVCYFVLCAATLCSGVWYYHFTSGNCFDRLHVVIATSFPYFWDAGISIATSALFIHKLKSVNRGITIDKHCQDNGGYIKIQQTAAKFTVLTCSSILFSLLFLFLYEIIGVTAATSDLLVNAFLLILSFKAYNTWYCFCCYACRKCC
ncbi:hypothetical protein RFI_27313 [Reticulomyxa filosa]|uniref:Uncharacterized protein n=1 Tax=Reticulomyxa filosa TaxID=46433 RepID=X6M7V9_RETFI|nr:hypothetical protein RFI_27313 [Reticulomyxa filosa]|eukprot:ETO10068.1 hypothetical protein RFI_27313 [Reticulomyxa filosa]